jgi:exopolyphosphatase/pppGpp-phosphohydrolase
VFGSSPIGVIDIGSSAIRLEVSVHGFGDHVLLRRAREKVALGEPVFRTGRIPRSVAKDASAAVARLAELARRAGAAELVVVATAALREAQNRDEIVARIEEEAKVHVEVISTAEEAALLARAATASLSLERTDFLSCHVGGGSTELSVVRNGELAESVSIPVGSLRLAQLFDLGPSAPSALELLGLEAYVRRACEIAGTAVVQRGLRAVVSSGSVRALARMRGRGSTVLSRDDAVSFYTELSHLTRERRARAAGVGERRADLLLGASAIAAILMERFSIAWFETTRYGLAAGVAMRVRKKIASISEGHHPARRISKHALQLFHAIEPELELEPGARRILAIAAGPAGDGHRIAAGEREERLARAVVEHALAIEARVAHRRKFVVPAQDRAIVRKLGAILATTSELERELGDSLACIDVALARDEGLLILRTRGEHRAFRGPSKRALVRLGRAVGRELSISIVPLLALSESLA